MIEDADQLASFLPISYRTSKEEEYVRFLWEAFHDNCASGKYQFAFLAYHMLTMCFVYFNIWQIKLIRPEDFAMALIGFGKETERDLLAASSPFTFHVINESTVMRFLKLIQCDNGKIGTYTKLVKDRNETAHSNGNIFYSTEDELIGKIREIVRVVHEIQGHSEGIILVGYKNFLVQSADPEGRQYAEIHDQVREVLIHENYMSLVDLDFCARFNIGEFSEHPHFTEIEMIHGEVCGWVDSEAALAA
jgi:hypothetical protein